MADVHRYGIIALAEVLVSPNLMEEFLRAHHLSLLPAEDLENGKLCRGQGEYFLIQCTLMGPDIQHKS